MRDEDYRGGSNKISGEGRGPLCFGEKQALAMQHRNREGDGKTWADNETARMKAITVDGDLKRPRFPNLKWGG